MVLCGIIKHHDKNEKPCVLGFWHFLTSERIAGFSASLSAETKTKDFTEAFKNSIKAPYINRLRCFFYIGTPTR